MEELCLRGVDQLFACVGPVEETDEGLGHLLEALDEIFFILEGSVLDPFA